MEIVEPVLVGSRDQFASKEKLKGLKMSKLVRNCGSAQEPEGKNSG